VSLSVLHTPTRTAVNAAAFQTVQRAAFLGGWAGQRYVGAHLYQGATLLEAQLYDGFIEGGVDPLNVTLGPFVARTFYVEGDVDRVVLRNGTTDMLTVTADVGEGSAPTGTFRLARRVTADSRPRLDAVDGFVGLIITMRTALPLTSTPTFALTFAVADTAVAGVAAAGSIINTGNQAQAWSITPPGGVTVTPNSGTLAAGDTQVLSVTAAAAGTPSLTLVAAGATITGNPQAITVSGAPSGPPTTATLSGPNGATVGVAHTSRVTLNQPADQAYTITWARSNSGTGPATSTISTGQTFVDASSTWAATGADRTVDFTISPSLTRAGRPLAVTVSEPVAAGAWQSLTFPTISRKVLSGTVPHGTTWDASNAQSLDDQAPVSTAVVPYRAFGYAVHGEPGVLYYFGGLHSNYQGNETDRIDARDLTSTAVGNAINHQPRRPPQGPQDGYDSGSSAYIYKMYGTPLDAGDRDEWQIYTYHVWCYDTYRPGDGRLFYATYAVADGTTVGANPNGEGSAYQVSSFFATGDRALVRYYKNGKYEYAASGPPGGLAIGGFSDYSAYRQSIICASCNGTTLRFDELVGTSWSNIGSFSMATIMAPGITEGQIVAGKDGNGILVRHMERNKYLVYTTSYYFPGQLGITTTLSNGNYANLIWVLDVAPIGGGGPTMTRVLLNDTLDSLISTYGINRDGAVGLTVDKASRAVYAMAVDGANSSGTMTGTVRVWAASFDDLATWTERSTTSAPTISHNFALDRQPNFVFNGHMLLLSGPEPNTTMRRVRLGNWEVAPSFTFYRHEQATQNFQLAAPVSSDVLRGKHANYAYRPVDGRYYQMGGDIAESFTQSSYALTVAPGSYTFTQELDELTPAPVGYVRPWCTDDGAWAYCGASNANTALADRFVYFRGGQGIGARSSVYMQSAYATQAAAEADRWTGALVTLYDPVNRRFTAPDLSGWTVSAGTDALDPRAYPADYSRNGAWDGTRNQMFRFAPGRLTRWDFDAQTIKVWNVAFTSTTDGNEFSADTTYNQALTSEFPSYVASASWPNMYVNDVGAGRYRTIVAAEWEHQATWLDESNGKLYVVSPFTGYLWCYETRGTERTNGDGTLTIPFYAIPGRIPLSFHWPQKPAAQWDVRMHSYLVPFKGGLLWTCDNPGAQDGGGRHAFWRRLGYTGEWTPITLPQDWAANGMPAKTRNDINNDEFIGLRADISVAGRNSTAFYLVR